MDTKELVKSEVQDFAEFNLIRYAQVWEDAEILLEALKIEASNNILSIASSTMTPFLFSLFYPCIFRMSIPGIHFLSLTSYWQNRATY